MDSAAVEPGPRSQSDVPDPLPGAPSPDGPRRVAAVVAVVLATGLAVVLGVGRVDYVVYAPGGAVDTLGTVRGTPVVAVSGRRTYETTGQLDLTTVSVTRADGAVGLAEAVLAWADPRREVLPRGLVYPDTTSASQAQAESRAQMQTSQESAVLAAAHQLGIPVTATTQVSDVSQGGPATGLLAVGDRLTAVDGRSVTGSAQLAAAVRSRRPGTEVSLGVVRAGGGARTVTVRLGSAPSGSQVPAGAGYLGIGLAESRRATGVQADIELGQKIGGPSAGLMFSLAIVDRLTPGTLPGDVHVAGTGTIDDDGVVGAIGGIHQKMLGARSAGATLFLAPSANCAEAAARPVPGLRLVRVADLAGAVVALQDAAAGRTGGLPAC